MHVIVKQKFQLPLVGEVFEVPAILKAATGTPSRRRLSLAASASRHVLDKISVKF